MAGRLGLMLLGAAALSFTNGCYRHHTADEEVEDIGPYDDEVSDAGVAVAASDAAPPRDGGLLPTLNCQSPADAIQQALCRAMTGTADAGAGQQPSFQDFINEILGGGGQIPGVGGMGQVPRPGGTGQISRTDGGARDAGAGRPGTGGLNCTNPSDQFTRILCGAMSGQARRDGGTQQPGGASQFADLLEALRDVDCDGEPQGLAALICYLGQFARDGGVGFPIGGRGNMGAPGGGNQGPRGL